jgi:asparagine synthase (glutamine-hydrolysing)
MGDEADRRIVGEYCAILVAPNDRLVRLSRSPLRAPPLYYASQAGLVVVASVPRAIFAAGIERQLNEVRVADSALINFTDREASWFKGVKRVPLASTVELKPGRERRLRTYYDLLSMPDIRMNSDDDYIRRAGELLDEAIARCIAGARKPGVTLSGGLDSPQVAARAMAQLPAGRKLPSFTFHPEPGWDGIVVDGMSGDERPFVEKFAEMHPGIEPHFTENRGYGHDYRWNEMFNAMGGATSGLCNVYVLHGLFAGAREQGCDLLLFSDWGNFTFSDKGEWAFVEYLLNGRWRELYLALAHHPNDDRSLLRKFVALSLVPLLPDSLWRAMMKLWHPTEKPLLDIMSPLRADYRKASGADAEEVGAGLRTLSALEPAARPRVAVQEPRWRG